MAAKDFGTAHLHGISGTVANATVVDFKIDEELGNRDETHNESGNVIERRSDDSTKTGSITLRIRTTYTIPAAGDVITYETVKYEVTKVGRSQTQRGFRTVELAILTSEFVTLP